MLVGASPSKSETALGLGSWIASISDGSLNVAPTRHSVSHPLSTVATAPLVTITTYNVGENSNKGDHSNCFRNNMSGTIYLMMLARLLNIVEMYLLKEMLRRSCQSIFLAVSLDR